MRDNCSTRLYSSTSVIKRKTLRSVVFICGANNVCLEVCMWDSGHTVTECVTGSVVS